MTIFDTAWLLIGNICSDAARPPGGSFNSVRFDVLRVGNAVPSSINAYFPST